MMEAYIGDTMKMPTITFTDTAVETNSTDDSKLKQEINNNTEKTNIWNFEKTDMIKDIRQGKTSDRTLTERLKDIGYCIRWIKDELQTLKEQDQAIAQKFSGMEADVHRLHGLLPSSPFTSCGSICSMDEDIYAADKLHLADDCEHEFRGRTSSLLLPRTNTLFSPSLRRKVTVKRALSNLSRPKSLTHLNDSKV